MASKNNQGTLIHLQLTFCCLKSPPILNLIRESERKLKKVPKEDFDI